MRWLLPLVLLVPLSVMGAGSAFAQDRAQSLADVKAELAQLASEFNTLKQELISTGAASNGSAGADPLARMDAMEAELSRLTAKTEAVQLKLSAVVSDGTNRIGDLEFRLCELTEGCDPSALPETPVLGAAADTAPVADAGTASDAGTAPADTGAATGTPDAGTGPEMAVNEQADFDRAQAVLASGDFRTAADLFATYEATYPGGALAQKAGVRRGDALNQTGETAKAARAYLDAFSGAPDGRDAAEALTKLGQSLGKLGQTPEACVTLAEVGKRFPGTPDDSNARTAMQGLGCP
ncbi:MAG: tol-pal system protein YbgF [Candidatus Saccharibacteria bacterium]|nr:tol-pal system protein YbgF [Pseudorhodobacter sp.]